MWTCQNFKASPSPESESRVRFWAKMASPSPSPGPHTCLKLVIIHLTSMEEANQKLTYVEKNLNGNIFVL